MAPDFKIECSSGYAPVGRRADARVSRIERAQIRGNGEWYGPPAAIVLLAAARFSANEDTMTVCAPARSLSYRKTTPARLSKANMACLMGCSTSKTRMAIPSRGNFCAPGRMRQGSPDKKAVIGLPRGFWPHADV